MESSEENSKSAVKIIRENACMDAVKPVNATKIAHIMQQEIRLYFKRMD